MTPFSTARSGGDHLGLCGRAVATCYAVARRTKSGDVSTHQIFNYARLFQQRRQREKEYGRESRVLLFQITPPAPAVHTIARRVATTRPQSPRWSPTDRAVEDGVISAHSPFGRFDAKSRAKLSRRPVGDMTPFSTARSGGDHLGLCGRAVATRSVIIWTARAGNVRAHLVP